MERSIKQVSPTEIIGCIITRPDGTKEAIKYENPIPYPLADSEEFRKSKEKEQKKVLIIGNTNTKIYSYGKQKRIFIIRPSRISEIDWI